MLFSWSGFLLLLRSDWLILSVKDWCSINHSVSVFLTSSLPEPSGYIISDRQRKQETRVTQVPDAVEQTSICASWDTYIYTLSRAGCGWTALVRSWDRWWQSTDKRKSWVFTGNHISLRFLLGCLMSCELILAKREPCSHSIFLALLIESSKSPGNKWTWWSSARALIIKAQGKCVLCK